jgi:2-(1,2-epoxy-1,2-dihydrophenyl)acetyl-CoA isomerase
MEIISKIENGVAWLTLNRPQVFNSFNKSMALELQDALKKSELLEQLSFMVRAKLFVLAKI